MLHRASKLFCFKIRPVILAAVVLPALLGGCAMWKESTMGHSKYPAGGGVLVDTNGTPIKAPTDVTANI